MLYIGRHEQILHTLSEKVEASVSELSALLAVSEVTVRKDLTSLEQMGCLIRTRGGARIAEDFRRIRSFFTRRGEHLEQKRAIAWAAKKMIRPGMTIFLDAGSTSLTIARMIIDMELHVVSSSLPVLTELAEAPGISVTSSGGSYRKEAAAFVGPGATRNLKQFHYDICFIGAAGFSEEGLFLSQNSLDGEVKELVIERSSQVVICADASKYGLQAFSIFAEAGDIDILITDPSLPEEGARALKAAGIGEITIAQGEES